MADEVCRRVAVQQIFLKFHDAKGAFVLLLLTASMLTQPIRRTWCNTAYLFNVYATTEGETVSPEDKVE